MSNLSFIKHIPNIHFILIELTIGRGGVGNRRQKAEFWVILQVSLYNIKYVQITYISNVSKMSTIRIYSYLYLQ